MCTSYLVPNDGTPLWSQCYKFTGNVQHTPDFFEPFWIVFIIGPRLAARAYNHMLSVCFIPSIICLLFLRIFISVMTGEIFHSFVQLSKTVCERVEKGFYSHVNLNYRCTWPIASLWQWKDWWKDVLFLVHWLARFGYFLMASFTIK